MYDSTLKKLTCFKHDTLVSGTASPMLQKHASEYILRLERKVISLTEQIDQNNQNMARMHRTIRAYESDLLALGALK